MNKQSVEIDAEARKADNVHQLLWTGGWDSTYRLIEIVVFLKETVQPYYIIDPERRSLFYEMRAMQWIKKELFNRFPDTKKRIKPTSFIELQSIRKVDRITESYLAVCEKYPVGIQYDWLARFSYQYSIKNLELCMEKSFDPNSIMNKILVRDRLNGNVYYKTDPALEGEAEYTLYGNFLFPIRELTKLDMYKISIKSGFDDIMNKTWFCHQPLANGTPCGVCVPCTQLMKKGMGYRLPFYSRLRYRFRLILSIHQLKKSFPEIYDFLKRIKNIIKN